MQAQGDVLPAPVPAVLCVSVSQPCKPWPAQSSSSDCRAVDHCRGVLALLSLDSYACSIPAAPV